MVSTYAQGHIKPAVLPRLPIHAQGLKQLLLGPGNPRAEAGPNEWAPHPELCWLNQGPRVRS